MINKINPKLINLCKPLLIVGPTGCGKSKLAKAIFLQSKVNKERFLTMHLASIKEDIFESEFFGHKKGAFSGAVADRKGYLSEVGEGTLFLDEIGDLSLDSQKKLLYVLQEKQFTPMGDTKEIPFKGRIILATHRNLEEMVKKGQFREDLYFRISMFQHEIPGLYETGMSKNFINEIFSEKLKELGHDQRYYLSNHVHEKLMGYNWPGNMRELLNCLEFMAIMANGEIMNKWEIGIEYLPNSIKVQNKIDGEIKKKAPVTGNYGDALAEFEKAYFTAMLFEYKGKINETARQMKISKNTLLAKVRKYQLATP